MATYPVFLPGKSHGQKSLGRGIVLGVMTEYTQGGSKKNITTVTSESSLRPDILDIKKTISLFTPKQCLSKIKQFSILIGL